MIALLLLFISTYPLSTKAEVTDEQWIANKNLEIESFQKTIDQLTEVNSGLLESIADLKKEKRWWSIDAAINKSIKDFNETITSNNSRIRTYTDRVLAAEKQIQSLLLEKATTPAEKATAQKKYEDLTKNRRNNLVEMVNEAKIEGAGAIDNASCFTMRHGINMGNCLMRAAGWTGTLVTYLFAKVLHLSSLIFDASIFMSITMTRTWFTLTAVSSSWSLVRDFANIFFIFIMLYVAIGSIFELGYIGDPKKMLVHVIIVALLVNFSGFFVRVTVDASNILAYEFYQAMGGGGFEFQTIGTELVKKLSLTKLYNTNKPDSDTTDASVILEPNINRLSFLSIIVQTFGNIFIFLATSFVLLIASILFIIRTIVLLFLYIVSPFAFMSQIIPGGKFNYFKTWRDLLIKNALIAPGFLAPLYLVFLLLGEGGITDIGGTSSTAGWAIVGAGSGTLILINVIILGLVVSCIFIAQKIGVTGAEIAPNLAGKATALASRPLSRYGGRLANRVGTTIAGSEYAQRIAGSYPGQLIRRSWDTGVLRSARDTETARRVGQAMRNPLYTAGAGVGILAQKAGIGSGANVLGPTPFSRQVQERANTFLADLRNRERPEDRAVFLEGLMGATKREEFNAIYNQLNAQERREIETAASTTNVDLERRLREQRLSLTGRAGQQTAIEQIQNNRAAGANINAVEHLNQDDLNAVYRALTPQQRVQLDRDTAAAVVATPTLATLVTR
ncbi:MAG TPA: hypothetical protein P5274_02330, partial [Candidatus Paceibacterota bacterium]|nr:hypothetical protein [Candidatus Paceibacterota bacterium]